MDESLLCWKKQNYSDFIPTITGNQEPAQQLWYKKYATNKALKSKLVTVTTSDLYVWFSVLEPASLVHFWLGFGLQHDHLFESVLAPYIHQSSCNFTPLWKRGGITWDLLTRGWAQLNVLPLLLCQGQFEPFTTLSFKDLL